MLFSGAITTNQKLLNFLPMLRRGFVHKQAHGKPFKLNRIQGFISFNKSQSNSHIRLSKASKRPPKPRMIFIRQKHGFPSHNNTIAHYNAKSNNNG